MNIYANGLDVFSLLLQKAECKQKVGRDLWLKLINFLNNLLYEET